MFYYPNVLQYRTGHFSTIWLAATKAIKLSRRDYLKVNVQRTCNDIMDYVLVRAPPLQLGLPSPRFSLYLSSQLQYGVIIVYHHQCAFLLEEIQNTIDRLLRSAKILKIDLVESGRLVLTVPDGLSMLEEYEGAQDPFFGVMEYTMPSPSAIMQWQVAEETSPHRPLVERLGTPQRDSITASPESITLVDREPVVIPAAEFEGADLAEVTPRLMGIIDVLMEQQDEYPEEVEEREEVREAERSREQQQAAVSVLQLGVTAMAAEDLTLLPEEEAETPAAAPPPLETTPVSVIPLLSPPEGEKEKRQRQEEKRRDTPGLEPEPVAPPKKRRRRWRQLLFIDEQTQIPSEELKEWIQDPHTQTQALLFEPPSRRNVSPVELLSNPCTAFHPDILDLWKRAAVITPLSSVAAEERLEEGETDSERGSLVAVELERVTEVREKDGSKEVASELVELEQPQPEASVSTELLGDVTDREVSHLVRPESRGFPREEILIPQDILEEEERPAEGEIEQVVLTRENLMGMLREPLQEHSEVSFHSLLPPLANRSTVACSFSALLGFVSARKLRVEQEESYGAIIITKGPRYEQEEDWVPQEFEKC